MLDNKITVLGDFVVVDLVHDAKQIVSLGLLTGVPAPDSVYHLRVFR